MKKIDKVLIGVAIATIIIGLGHPFIIKYLILKDKSFSELGTVGDWFGGLSGPLIGLSSFILVYLAFRLQGEQNRQQQIEFEKQNRILSLQRFESSFFQLLTFHNEIVQALWIDYKYVTKSETLKRKKVGGKEGEMEDYVKETKAGEESDKREYFSTVYLMMQHNLKEINSKSTELSKEMKAFLSYKESVAVENYSTVYNKEQASLGHYFRHLYHIVKYIHKSDLISDEQKKHYAALIRAQLSAYELVLLLYNCLVDDLGYPKFKYLVDKYDILQNLNNKLLLDPIDLEVFNSKKLTEDCLKDE
jgi:hypothetical protein